MQILNKLSKIVVIIALLSGALTAWGASPTRVIDAILPDTSSAPVKKPESKKRLIRTESIWSDISRELAMDHKVKSPEVQKQIRSLLANPKHFNKVLKSAAPYIYYIFSQTKSRGLPAELALIPFIESEYIPNNKSHVGAMGLWQLMPATARELGVKIHRGYDGRKNVVTSTKAALTYFNSLKKTFKGNWYLAIAAYNGGPGRVGKASRRAGGNRDFFQLNSLPRETRQYVPRLLAVAEIIKHPTKYGVEVPETSNSPFFTEIKLDKKKKINLNQFAKQTGIDKKALSTLNPDIRNGIVSDKNSKMILVPASQAGNIKSVNI